MSLIIVGKSTEILSFEKFFPIEVRRGQYYFKERIFFQLNNAAVYSMINKKFKTHTLLLQDPAFNHVFHQLLERIKQDHNLKDPFNDKYPDSIFVKVTPETMVCDGVLENRKRYNAHMIIQVSLWSNEDQLCISLKAHRVKIISQDSGNRNEIPDFIEIEC